MSGLAFLFQLLSVVLAFGSGVALQRYAMGRRVLRNAKHLQSRERFDEAQAVIDTFLGKEIP